MLDISFIIPAYNEQAFISQTVRSVCTYVANKYSFETIVVDHGSSDDTVQLARAAGAQVCLAPNAKTISELRNIGINQARGNVLVFLDADTTITQEWIDNFPITYEEVLRNLLLIVGSKREVPESASWVSRYWFIPDKDENEPTYLAGGHIITTKALCTLIGGFAPELETGEDYEFCVRAKRKGSRIIARPALRTLHHGVPENIRQFFRREIWHGRGDWQKLSSILDSKVALVSMLFVLLHVTWATSLLVGYELLAPISALLPMAIALVCVMTSVTKYGRRTFLETLANAILFYVYFWARSISLISVILRRSAARHMRGT